VDVGQRPHEALAVGARRPVAWLCLSRAVFVARSTGTVTACVILVICARSGDHLIVMRP
jgi:hypothetical protein